MSNLPEILRPKTLDDVIGQDHLIGANGPIRKLLESKNITSMIFWGPPGVGKTTVARLIPNYIDASFIPYSAVTGSVKQVREIIKNASILKKEYNKRTVLFVDEIHRFNKSQQDAFLPAVEDETIILIGATTENPGFSVNSPLLSRSQLYIFRSLKDDDIKKLLDKSINTIDATWTNEAKEFAVLQAAGDARKIVKIVELASQISNKIDLAQLEQILQQKNINYDRTGDNHYDAISAFIKSMRGNQPDATIHYLARMLTAGEDPVFIARRMVIFASEDIGNAEPLALVMATSCMDAIKMIGMPEAKLILAQTATFLATAKKSIASTMAISEAESDIENLRIDPIPLHLRNPKNKVMKKLGYGKDHVRYPWLEEKSGKKVDQEYMPKNLVGKKYYKKDWTEGSESSNEKIG